MVLLRPYLLQVSNWNWRLVANEINCHGNRVLLKERITPLFWWKRGSLRQHWSVSFNSGTINRFTAPFFHTLKFAALRWYYLPLHRRFLCWQCAKKYILHIWNLELCDRWNTDLYETTMSIVVSGETTTSGTWKTKDILRMCRSMPSDRSSYALEWILWRGQST